MMGAMSRYGLVGQLALTALFAVMTVIMGVVLLVYVIYIDMDPRMPRDLPFLTRVTGWFLAASVFFGLGSWALQRRHWTRWVWWVPQIGVLLALWGMIQSLRVAS
ncbi:MAG TPA: hypothetical protein DDW98_08230 [Gammaproteobacteria bacterium]|jgi:cell division protein FtsW (lipid II flippase)|nr:hypothetical protein [Gammaproteobacteria bacterium]HBG50610.1 hypothetical protein [Gammaproteobacteria bacterium]